MRSSAKGFTLKKRTFEGFTLIELLITIAILGILSSLTVVMTTKHQKTARDAQRKSDLNQFRILLENFANSNGGLYKSYTTVQYCTKICTDLGITTGCPADPNGSGAYYYTTDGTSSGVTNATNYVIYGKLELPSSPSTYYIICQNGKSGTVAPFTLSVLPISSTYCPL